MILQHCQYQAQLPLTNVSILVFVDLVFFSIFGFNLQDCSVAVETYTQCILEVFSINSACFSSVKAQSWNYLILVSLHLFSATQTRTFFVGTNVPIVNKEFLLEAFLPPYVSNTKIQKLSLTCKQNLSNSSTNTIEQ